jgi:hypothetical protein
MTIIQILGLLLALSVAGNAWLGSSYLGARDERTQAIGQRDQARGAASMCSDATEALQEAAGQRTKENAAAVAQAAAAGAARERRAQLQLSTPATRPGNDCGSAGDRFDNWLKGRTQ